MNLVRYLTIILFLYGGAQFLCILTPTATFGEDSTAADKHPGMSLFLLIMYKTEHLNNSKLFITLLEIRNQGEFEFLDSVPFTMKESELVCWSESIIEESNNLHLDIVSLIGSNAVDFLKYIDFSMISNWTPTDWHSFYISIQNKLIKKSNTPIMLTLNSPYLMAVSISESDLPIQVKPLFPDPIDISFNESAIEWVLKEWENMPYYLNRIQEIHEKRMEYHTTAVGFFRSAQDTNTPPFPDTSEYSLLINKMNLNLSKISLDLFNIRQIQDELKKLVKKDFFGLFSSFHNSYQDIIPEMNKNIENTISNLPKFEEVNQKLETLQDSQNRNSKKYSTIILLVSVLSFLFLLSLLWIYIRLKSEIQSDKDRLAGNINRHLNSHLLRFTDIMSNKKFTLLNDELHKSTSDKMSPDSGQIQDINKKIEMFSKLLQNLSKNLKIFFIRQKEFFDQMINTIIDTSSSQFHSSFNKEIKNIQHELNVIKEFFQNHSNFATNDSKGIMESVSNTIEQNNQIYHLLKASLDEFQSKVDSIDRSISLISFNHPGAPGLTDNLPEISEQSILMSDPNDIPNTSPSQPLDNISSLTQGAHFKMFSELLERQIETINQLRIDINSNMEEYLFIGGPNPKKPVIDTNNKVDHIIYLIEKKLLKSIDGDS